MNLSSIKYLINKCTVSNKSMSTDIVNMQDPIKNQLKFMEQ